MQRVQITIVSRITEQVQVKDTLLLYHTTQLTQERAPEASARRGYNLEFEIQ